MADDEKLYTIPLRAALRVPRTRRAERAVDEVRNYIARHAKTKIEQVWLDPPVSEAIWTRGRQKPPRRIRVKAIKFEDGIVEVSLPEAEVAGSKREAAAEERAKAREVDAESHSDEPTKPSE